MLALQRSAGNAAVASLMAQRSASVPVQRFEEKKDTDGDPWRVSESGKSALFIQQAEGGQQLFATKDLVDDANDKLAKAGPNGSFVELTRGDPLKAGLLDSVSADVAGVKPKLAGWVGRAGGDDPENRKLRQVNRGKKSDDQGSKSQEFALWADCGKSSRSVMGGGDNILPTAHVRVAGKDVQSAPSVLPSTYTNVYRLALPDFMKLNSSKPYLVKGVHWTRKWLRKVYKTPADDKEAKAMYWALGEAGRQAFDMTVGINIGANPEIGGAYTMSTENDMPGFSRVKPMTWNFHWAGVVMKDGANNITLENYAVQFDHDPDPVKQKQNEERAYDWVNRDWTFQMYGTKKKGQTFHEEHLASGTHGTRGSTFAVSQPKVQTKAEDGRA